jgi:MraZ protein
MLLLTGEYDLTIDEKNRLSIPAKVRDQIPADEYGNGFYLVPGVDGILCLYPDLYYQRIALAVAPRMVAPDEFVAFERVNFALAGKAGLDRQGRVLLTEKAIRRAGLKERVSLIGVRDHLEIWDTDQWERYLSERLQTHEQLLLQVREESMKQESELANRYTP